MKKQIQVLIVEDSPTARELLVHIISDNPGLVVVGQARNGAEGVRLTRRLKPDVISMDVNMPIMNGFEAVREIMQVEPTPVVVVSASMQFEELDVAFNAMKAGALAVLRKPAGPSHPDFAAMRDELVTTLKLMAGVAVVTHRPARAKVTGPLSIPPFAQNGHIGQLTVVGLASSTGGPSALEAILSALPADFPVPILLVQHISAGFENGLADWLNRTCPLAVSVAQNGQKPEPGQVLIAPSGTHLRLSQARRVLLDRRPGPYDNVPSADVLLASLAEHYGQQAMGVVLTGMGADGAAGLRAIRDAGGTTLAQDEESSVVFGMPKEAVILGGAERIVSLAKMAKTITVLASKKNRQRIR